ncbi:MAG: oligosaccharide flippase family protein [Phycisphaerales bacterium]|nr:oligosaccharide flippase family protein [Phycisphaerales bacterium]
MPTEAKRGLIRIGSNYARLGSTLVFGIALVPLLAGWLGGDALGLFLFLMAQAGLAAIFQDVMRTSLIRELASAWHGESDFGEAAAAASLVCLATAGLAVVAFALLWAVMPVLNIPGDGLVDAARWIIVLEGAFTVLNIQLAPAVNLYVVRECFVQQNMWTLLRRADFLISVLLCRFVLVPDADVETGLITFAAVAVGWRTFAAIAAAAIMWVREPRILPRPWRATRAGVRNIVGTFGWNTSTILATNLHDRAGAFIVNIFFGLWGNTVFGLATRLVSYIRMMTIGMTFGLDAVGARLAAQEDDGSGLRNMVTNATRMHAMMAIPAAIGTAVLAEPLLRLWIGRSLEDADRYIDMSALLVQIMAVGLAARAISDGWVFLLYGAGHIRRYAKIIVVGGLLDPLLAIALAVALPALGEGQAVPWNAVTGPAWAVSLSFLFFHGFLLPMRGARILQVRRRVFVTPLVPPALLAGALSPLLMLPHWCGDGVWSLLDLAISGGVYGVCYAILAVAVLLTPQERQRIVGAARRAAGAAR